MGEGDGEVEAGGQFEGVGEVLVAEFDGPAEVGQPVRVGDGVTVSRARITSWFSGSPDARA